MSQNYMQMFPVTTDGSSNLTDPKFSSMAKACEILLHSVGENPTREGLVKTPERFAKAIFELCEGYNRTPADAVGEGIFAAEGRGLVSVKNIEFYSLCEHHMLPFWGHVSIAYYPGKTILGLSKLPRLVEVFARRLQVQERLTREIAEAIMGAVSPRAVAVKIEASHMCMSMRGVRCRDSSTQSEFCIGDDSLSDRERERLWDAL
jgi:GTP cyclohydrolase IA